MSGTLGVIFVCLILVIDYAVLNFLYKKRNKLFEFLGQKYELRVKITKYPCYRFIKWGDELELRRLEGIIKGKQILISDSIESRAILAPWWYRDLFRLAQISTTRLKVDREVTDIGAPIIGFARPRQSRRWRAAAAVNTPEGQLLRCA
jgi:hypothetical protein